MEDRRQSPQPVVVNVNACCCGVVEELKAIRLVLEDYTAAFKEAFIPKPPEPAVSAKIIVKAITEQKG